jgi:hypothetical protein
MIRCLAFSDRFRKRRSCQKGIDPTLMMHSEEGIDSTRDRFDSRRASTGGKI